MRWENGGFGLVMTDRVLRVAAGEGGGLGLSSRWEGWARLLGLGSGTGWTGHGRGEGSRLRIAGAGGEVGVWPLGLGAGVSPLTAAVSQHHVLHQCLSLNVHKSWLARAQ